MFPQFHEFSLVFTSFPYFTSFLRLVFTIFHVFKNCQNFTNFDIFTDFDIFRNFHKFSRCQELSKFYVLIFYLAATAKKRQAQKRIQIALKNQTMVRAVQFLTTLVPAAAGFAQKKMADKFATIRAPAELE